MRDSTIFAAGFLATAVAMGLYANAGGPDPRIASTSEAEVCATDGLPGSAYSRTHRRSRPGRAGYEHDHIVPLGLGGADTEANLQWQPLDEARRKDALERFACRAVCRYHSVGLAEAQAWFLGRWQDQMWRVGG